MSISESPAEQSPTDGAIVQRQKIYVFAVGMLLVVLWTGYVAYVMILPVLRQQQIAYEPVYGVAFAPDGVTVYGAHGVTGPPPLPPAPVLAWSVPNNPLNGDPPAPSPVRQLDAHWAEATVVKLTRNGTIAWTRASDGAVRRWPVDSDAAIDAWPPSTERDLLIYPIKREDHTLDVSANEEVVTLLAGGTLYLRTPDTEDFIPYAPALGRAFRCVAVSREGRFVAVAGESGEVELFDRAEERTARVLHRYGGVVTAIALAEQHAAIAGMDGVDLIEFPSGNRIRRFPSPRTFCVAFSPDGSQLAYGGFTGVVDFWSVDPEGPHGTLHVQRGAIFDLAFSPDGKRLATASGKLQVWDLASERSLATFPPQSP